MGTRINRKYNAFLGKVGHPSDYALLLYDTLSTILSISWKVLGVPKKTDIHLNEPNWLDILLTIIINFFLILMIVLLK